MRLDIFYFVLSVISCANCLDILLTTSNSWVTKNTRFLHKALQEEGHNVKLVGPLEDFGGISTHEIDANWKKESTSSSGDFNHLLEVHQKYFESLQRIQRKKRVRNVITESEISNKNVISNEKFGQDPLDKSAWYVASSPVSALLIAFDVIIPQFMPEFVPDMVIIGPNEGATFTTSSKNRCGNETSAVETMMDISLLKGYPTISLSTEDNHHIYFKDESYFSIMDDSPSEALSKRNSFTKNIKFINARVIDLVNKISKKKALEQGVALNINFPSMNHEGSHCETRFEGSVGPEFQQVIYEKKVRTKKNLEVPKYYFEEGSLVKSGSEKYFYGTVGVPSEIDVHDSPSTYVDEESEYYQYLIRQARDDVPDEPFQDLFDNPELNALIDNSVEAKVLEQCGISVNVITKDGEGLGTSIFDLNKVMT